MGETPRILGAYGETLSGGAQPLTYDDFTVSANFDVDQGLGQVVFRVPQATPLTDKDWAEILAVMSYRVDKPEGITDRIMAASQTPPMLLHPAEARLLGLYLISEAEKAIGTAISMRILLGLTEPPMPGTEAVSLFNQLSQNVRSSHAVQHALTQREIRNQRAMQEDPHGTGSS